MSVRILISTGEVSGDLQGSLLIQALNEEASARGVSLEVIALGGSRMAHAGAELIADTAPMGAIGLWEALPYVLPTLRLQAKVDQILRQRKPDAVVLIDYMGPNIRLGKKVKQMLPLIPIHYYIAPQEWAWRLGDGGTTELITFTDRILAIFPAEAEFYSQKGAKVSWVGHPLVDTLTTLPDLKQARQKLGLESWQKLLLLLPASRTQELRYVMPTLIQAASLLQKRDQSIEVIIPAGLKSFEEPLRRSLKEAEVRGRVISAKEWASIKSTVLAVTNLALGKSGTVNMELALHEVPQIVGYRVSRITAFIARNILKFNVDHISPVNLLLNERLVPELIQEEFTPSAILDLAIPLLEKSETRLSMLLGYKRLRKILGTKGVTQRAAKVILDSIKT